MDQNDPSMSQPEDGTSSPRLSRVLQVLSPDRTSFAVLTLLFLSLLFTYPIIFNLSTHLIGGTADGWQFPWNNFIFRERVLHWQDPYYTDYVFYPAGVSLVLHGYTEFNDFIGLFLFPFFNDVAITNLMVILATFLSGLGMYFLTRDLTKSQTAALFAAIVFAFCPFRMIRITGHIHMILTQFIPFAIWAFLKMDETGKFRYSFWTGLFFALACYSNYYFAVYLILAFVFMLFYGWIRYPRWRTIQFLRSVALSVVWALLFLLPVMFHVYSLLMSSTDASYNGAEEFLVKQSATLRQYLMVSPLNTTIQALLGKNPIIWPYSKITPGWTALFFALGGFVYAVRHRFRHFGMLVFMGFCFFVLSLGPYLEVTDQLRIPLPYSFVAKITLLNHARIPERFSIMVILVIAILAAYLLGEVVKKLTGVPRKVVVVCTFGLLLFELTSFPYPMEAFDPPKIFYELGKTEGNSLLSLPFYPGDIRAKKCMRFQSVHMRKLLDGRVSRNPWAPIKYVQSIPIANTFRGITIGGRPPENSETDRRVAPLFREFFDLRYLALYPPFGFRPAIRNYVQEIFPDAKLLSDEKGILLYELPKLDIRYFRCTRSDPGIRYFLYENWEVDRKGYKIICHKDQAKLLLPNVKSGERLRMKLVMKNRQPRDRAVKLKVGSYLASQNALGPKLGLWKLEIPGDILIREGRIAQLEFPNRSSDSGVELQSVEMEIVGSH